MMLTFNIYSDFGIFYITSAQSPELGSLTGDLQLMICHNIIIRLTPIKGEKFFLRVNAKILPRQFFLRVNANILPRHKVTCKVSIWTQTQVLQNQKYLQVNTV